MKWLIDRQNFEDASELEEKMQAKLKDETFTLDDYDAASTIVHVNSAGDGASKVGSRIGHEEDH